MNMYPNRQKVLSTPHHHGLRMPAVVTTAQDVCLADTEEDTHNVTLPLHSGRRVTLVNNLHILHLFLLFLFTLFVFIYLYTAFALRASVDLLGSHWTVSA